MIVEQHFNFKVALFVTIPNFPFIETYFSPWKFTSKSNLLQRNDKCFYIECLTKYSKAIKG